MLKLKKKTFRLYRDERGAAAVEAAIVFPLLAGSLFAIFGFGSYMYGSHQAQRTVEQTAREVRMIDNPTKEDLALALSENMKTSSFGTYTPRVTMVSQYDGTYAELSVDYAFKFAIPGLSNLALNSTSRTQVKIRNMPI